MPRKLILPLLITSTSALAGGMSSSGTGDIVTMEHNPWFIGDQRVAYCVQTSADISLDEPAAREEIKAAIADWTAMLRATRPQLLTWAAPATEFVETACSSATDLTFKIGVFDQDIEDDLRHMAAQTIGYAQMRRFDWVSGRAQGDIWLVPDLGARRFTGDAVPRFWSHAGALYSVVLHELGHIFGFRHGRQGFMAAGYPAEVVSGRGDRLDTRGNAVRASAFELTLAGWVDELSGESPTHASAPVVEFCGRIAFDAGYDVVADVLGFPKSPLYLACLQRQTAPRRLQLRILDAAGSLLGNLPIAVSRLETTSFGITGFYRHAGPPVADGMDGPFSEVHPLSFVDDYDIFAITRVNGRDVPLLVTGDTLRAALTFVVESGADGILYHSLVIDWVSGASSTR
jgi:hypothetical protein